MNDLLFFIGAKVVGLACVVCACILAVNGNVWFWLFLLLALFTHPTVTVRKD